MSSRSLTTLLLVLILVVLVLILIRQAPAAPAAVVQAPPVPQVVLPTSTRPAAAPNAGSQAIGRRTRTSGCVSQGGLPDSACTPGDIIRTATREEICQPGYSKNVRLVTTEEKDAVYLEYGVRSHTAGEYEVDHLISLELGGSNGIANLWPEPAEPRPGFHEKDEVENYLHEQVCRGAISLQQAQAEIAHDWLAVYRRIHP